MPSGYVGFENGKKHNAWPKWCEATSRPILYMVLSVLSVLEATGDESEEGPRG